MERNRVRYKTAMPEPMLDAWTLDTLLSMVRYIKDDRRIGRYLSIGLHYVEWTRTCLPDPNRDPITVSRKGTPSEHGERLGISSEPWMRQAREATERLGNALALARS